MEEGGTRMNICVNGAKGVVSVRYTIGSVDETLHKHLQQQLKVFDGGSSTKLCMIALKKLRSPCEGCW